MPPERRNDNSTFVFNSIFSAMGAILLLVAAWIGKSVADIPSIKQEIHDMKIAITTELGDHENRIRNLEHHR